MLPVAGAGRAAASAAPGPVAAFVGHPVTGAASPGPTRWPGGLAPAVGKQLPAGFGADGADQIQMPASGGSTVQLGLCCWPVLPGLSLSGVHGRGRFRPQTSPAPPPPKEGEGSSHLGEADGLLVHLHQGPDITDPDGEHPLRHRPQWLSEGVLGHQAGEIHRNRPVDILRITCQAFYRRPFIELLKSALSLLAISLFVLPASSWAESIDPKIHKQCKDARDYTGCVKAFTSPPPPSDDGLSGLRAAMKQVSARIRSGFSLRDSTLFFQPLTDQLALVRSTYPGSLAVTNASKAEELFGIVQTAWQSRINTLSVGTYTGTMFSCSPTQQGVEAFNRVAGSQVVTYSVKGGLFGLTIGCYASVGERHEAMMLSYVAGLLDNGSVSPEEIAEKEKAIAERRAQAAREYELCAMGPWNRYLEENPEMKKWVQINPRAAKTAKEKFLSRAENKALSEKVCSIQGGYRNLTETFELK